MADELLPCPFCGGSASVERAGSARQSTIYACDECGCRLETGEVFDIGRRWNTRHQPNGGAGVEDAGRITGWHMQDGVTVFDVATASGLPHPGFVLLSDYQAKVSADDAVKRLRDAIEGECDGLGISEATARAILIHVGPSAGAEDARDAMAERICNALCEQEYDIGGRDELLKHIRAAMSDQNKGKV